MAKRFLKTLTNNLGFKLLALLFAFVLWLFVYNIDDPLKGKTFNVTINYDNIDKIKEANYYPLISPGSDTISVYVTAKKSVIENLDDASFSASADLSQFSAPEADDEGNLKTTVKVSVKCMRSVYETQLDYSGKNSQEKEIDVEEYIQKKCKLVAQTEGEPANGYALDSSATNLATSRMTIKGPKSVVDKISEKAYVNIDISDAYDDFTGFEKYTLVYEDGEKVPQEEVDMLDISSKYDSISYSVSILPMKELPIRCTTVGEPAGGNQVRAIKCSPSTVTVMGESEDTKTIDKIEITDPIDVTGITEDLTVQVNIAPYLPEGIKLVNAEQAIIDVTVKVKAYKTKSFTVDTANIKCEGIDTSLYDVVFSSSSVTLEVSGAEDDLEEIKEDQLTGTIELSSYGEGTHNVTVTMDLDGTKYSFELTVQVTISAKKTDDSGGTTGDSDTGSGGDSSGGSDESAEEPDSNSNADGDSN